VTVGESKDRLKFSVDDPNITLEAVIEVIKDKQKNQLGTFKDKVSNKIYEILEGPYGKYIRITDTKTKKKSNIKLPEGTDIPTLSIDKLKEIVSAHYKNFKNKFKKNTEPAIPTAEKKGGAVKFKKPETKRKN
jgi:hypothetical protein